MNIFLTNSIHKKVFEFLFVAYIKLLNIIEYNVEDNLAFSGFIREDQKVIIRASISTDKSVIPVSH